MQVLAVFTQHYAAATHIYNSQGRAMANGCGTGRGENSLQNYTLIKYTCITLYPTILKIYTQSFAH